MCIALRSILKIFALSLCSCIGWTIIPRTNSIIYQSYWLEYLLANALIMVTDAGQHSLNLTTWLKAKDWFSVKNYLKMFALNMGPYTIGYILSYVIWSVYLEFYHPLPNLGLYLYLINLIVVPIGLWFILPSNLLTEKQAKFNLSSNFCGSVNSDIVAHRSTPLMLDLSPQS